MCAAIALVGKEDAHLVGERTIAFVFAVEQESEVIGVHDGEVTYAGRDVPDLIAI